MFLGVCIGSNEGFSTPTSLIIIPLYTLSLLQSLDYFLKTFFCEFISVLVFIRNWISVFINAVKISNLNMVGIQSVCVCSWCSVIQQLYTWSAPKFLALCVFQLMLQEMTVDIVPYIIAYHIGVLPARFNVPTGKLGEPGKTMVVPFFHLYLSGERNHVQFRWGSAHVVF